jgi:cytochrome c
MSQFNTIAGWALAGGIVALGSSIVMGEVFHAERPETMGYHVEGVEAEGGAEEAEMTIAEALNTATVEQGENIFRRCASCHTINQGGADGIGPNLYGVVGAVHGHRAGYAYSSVIAEMAGPWDFDALNEWLRRPSAYAPGTKMSFAGLSDPLDRAAVILYMNAQGSNVALPPPPAAEEETEAEDAAVEDAEDADPEAEAATEADIGEAAPEGE